MARGQAWLLADGAAMSSNRWDKKGFRLPGGTCRARRHGSCSWGRWRSSFRGRPQGFLRRQPRSWKLYDGCMLILILASKSRTRQFARLAVSPQAQNMIRTLFYAIGDANKLIGRPQAVRYRLTGKIRRSSALE